MPKVTEAHLEARREQILGAAIACFARQGFHQTTVDDICKEAGLSPGAVYRYFTSKEEIIEACCEGCQQADLSAIQGLVETGDTLRALDRLAEIAFDDLSDPEAGPILRMNVQWWSEAMRSPELGASLKTKSIDLWKGALARIVALAQEAGNVDTTLDPESVGRVLLATWQGLVLQKALDPDVDVRRYVDALRALYGGTFWRNGGGEGQRGEPVSHATHSPNLRGNLQSEEESQ